MSARWLHSPRSSEPREVSELFDRSLAQSEKLRELFSGIERFCLFVGYPRSGHSLVGSLLDAHPDIAVAHELDALGFLEAGFSMPQIYSLILENHRAFTDQGRRWEDYQYEVAGQWQGRFRNLRVIGDKNGGLASRRLRAAPELLSRFGQAAGVEIKLIHVVRNPYDNIATMFRRSQYRDLREAIELYFSMCETVSSLAALHTLHLEALIASPRETLQQLTHFLGVEAAPDYLDACAGLVWKSPKRTRSDVGWTRETLALVRERAEMYPHLRGYPWVD